MKIVLDYVAPSQCQKLRLPPGIAHSPVSLLCIETNCKIGLSLSWCLSTCPFSVRFHLVTIGSAAWLGPYRPSIPRPESPVLPLMLSGSLFLTYTIMQNKY